jgi:hypothetical protein
MEKDPSILISYERVTHVSGMDREKLASPSVPSWNQLQTWLRDLSELRDAGIQAA